MDRCAARLAAGCAVALLVAAAGLSQDSRAAALDRAIKWLDAHTAAPAGPDPATRGVLDEPKSIVVSAMRLWIAEIAAGGRGVGDGHATLESVVGRGARGDAVAMGAYANWMAGFAAFPLIERSLRTRRADAALARLVAGFEERQNAEGGWGHGAGGGMVAFYPSTLVITTDFALFALGMARRLEVPVDGEVIDAGLRLLSDVQAQSGAFPYGGRPYRRGFEAGRTAGAVAALAAMGLSNDDRFRRAASYLRANMAATPDGHASPAVHVLWGGVASAVLGDDARRAWEQTVMARLLEAQADDGSFEDIVEESPDSMALMGSAATNRAYVTALYAAALAAPRSRIVATLRATSPRVAPAYPEPPATPEAAWTTTGGRIVALDGDAAHVATLSPSGVVTLRAADTGRKSWESAVPGVTEARGGSEVIVDRDLVFVFAATATGGEPLAIGGVALGTSRPAGAGSLVAFAAADGSVRWTNDVAGLPASWQPGGSAVWMRRRTGSLARFDRATGAVRIQRGPPAVPVNTTAAWLEDGRFASTDHATLVMHDSAGGEVWRRSLRAPRGVHAPAWSALSVDGPRLLSGSTDGAVGCWALADGARIWERSLGASVSAIARAPDAAEIVLAMTDDGRIFGLSDDAIAWVREAGAARESTRPARLRTRGGAAWIASPAAQSLVRVDSRDGRVVARLPLPGGAVWATFGDRAWVAGDDACRCWRVP